MAVAEKNAPMIKTEDLGELLSLIKSSDSVELKLTIPEADHLTTMRELKMDALDAQIRQVFFFDTPNLDLYEHGVVPRARRVQGKTGDSVVKLRPVVPDELPKSVRKSPSFGVEVDAMPGGFVCSGSLKGVTSNDAVREVSLGRGPISSLFSKEQRSFYAEHAPKGLELDDLSILGPLFVLKLRFVPADFSRKLVAELWLYPDNSRVLELSTKTVPTDAFLASAETRAYFASHGIDTSGEQSTKTRKALDFYAKQLKAPAPKKPAVSTASRRKKTA